MYLEGVALKAFFVEKNHIHISLYEYDSHDSYLKLEK